ncbi:hypothetical protein [Sphingosinicella sp.]|uniref:hypothetical protein n=1 Tax=Sphingosinicella sp. TaxID=1917971 RepID=UPI0040379587
MKKLAVIGLVAISSAAWAAPVVSDNASSNACFGQARAFYVHLLGGRTWGDIASDRAGSNAALNRDYRDSCRG